MRCIDKFCGVCPYYPLYQNVLKTAGKCHLDNNNGVRKEVPDLSFSQFMQLLISPTISKDVKEFVKKHNENHVKMIMEADKNG